MSESKMKANAKVQELTNQLEQAKDALLVGVNHSRDLRASLHATEEHVKELQARNLRQESSLRQSMEAHTEACVERDAANAEVARLQGKLLAVRRHLAATHAFCVAVGVALQYFAG